MLLSNKVVLMSLTSGLLRTRSINESSGCEKFRARKRVDEIEIDRLAS